MMDKQMLEQAIENARDVLIRLEEQHKELYGYKDSDLDSIVSLLAKHNKKGLTVREVRQRSRVFSSTSSEKTQEALQVLVDSGQLIKTTNKKTRGKPSDVYFLAVNDDQT